MPVMSVVERTFCRSAMWRWWARTVVLPWSLNGFVPEGEVLEIGGGSGAMAQAMVRSHPEVRLTFTDVDNLMIATARRRLGTSASVRRADARNLPFPDGAFDVASSHLMLHHVIDWEQVVSELARSLRPGGVLVGYDLTSTRLATWLHRLDGSPYRLLGPDELERHLQAVGFNQVVIRVGLLGHVMRFRALKAT